jgi:hypothetical protein
MSRMYAGRKAATTTCKQCSKRFPLHRSDAKFCSPKCRGAYNRDLKARQAAAHTETVDGVEIVASLVEGVDQG